MKHWKAVGLEAFLSAYPNIRLVDVHADKIELQGEYQLKAQLAGSRFIERTFSLRIVCPSDYPRALPVVFDTAGYFPRNQDFHTYSDGSFCLGSDLKIKSILKADSSLTTFFEKIVVRFLILFRKQIRSVSIEFVMTCWKHFAHLGWVVFRRRQGLSLNRFA